MFQPPEVKIRKLINESIHDTNDTNDPTDYEKWT